MKYLMEVNIGTESWLFLHVRSGPSTANGSVGQLKHGNQVIATEASNGWYKHDKGGWSSAEYLRLVKNLESAPIATPAPTPPAPPAPPPLTEEEEKLLQSIYTKADIYSDTIDNIRYLFAAPYQFTELTDPRPENSKLGRTYMDTILNDMSMVVFTPGKAAFMSNMSSGAANKVLSKLVGSSNEDMDTSDLKDILEGKQVGRYYTFESDYVEYMKYVNNMCRLSSILLGIGDEKLFDGSKKFKDFDWDINNLAGTSSIFKFLTIEKSVAFFIDGKASSFSDGMSNSTRASMLAGAFEAGTNFSKEAYFLMGKAPVEEGIMQTSMSNFEGAVNKVVKTLTKNDTVAKQFSDRMGDHAVTLINGGNIAFPEIYDNSEYNSSYNIELKLVSPSADPISIYQNIYVPLWHLIALSYPRQSGANGYTSPFLVRTFCKGWFNCPLGIISAINIKRASQDGWSYHGMPTEVDVSITLTNLYENMTISRAGDFSTFHNTEFLDMLATWCGVNMNKPELSRKLGLYEAFISNTVKDILPNLTSEMGQNITNKLLHYLR